ncbi:MAG: Gfo/Idh/MocA family oxidoreductase [Armatimonadota bacterium]
MVKVGIVGTGIGGTHANGYSKCPDAEIAAICDIDQERCGKLCEKYNVKKFYTDYKEMLADDEIDAISVCTPNSLHAPFTIDALKAGKHVLCEKPMATNAADARKMVDVAKETGKILMMAFNNRFRGDTQLLKKKN